MTTISKITEPRGVAVEWAQVIILSQSTEELVFEVLESNAFGIKGAFGIRQLLHFDERGVFWGELMSLEYCASTAQGLALMRERPTFRGVLKIFPPEAEKVQ